jgi:hypothetical protein
MKIPEDCLKKYTIIQPDPTLRNNLMVFGFEIGEGWMSLVIELLDKIQHLVDNNPEYSGLQVIQVKEKYGSLRVYLNYYYKEIEDIISEYEEKSCYICEECGEKGEIRNINNWYTALCDKHYAEYKEK